MKLEDIVKQALVQAGHEIPVDVVDEGSHADDSNDVVTTEDGETERLLAEVMIEFIRKQQVSFAQLSQIRRLFKRILMHLCTAEKPCTVGSIRNVVDPRYRKKVILLLTGMTKAGILQTFDDDTAKPRWFIAPQYKAQAIMFASEK